MTKLSAQVKGSLNVTTPGVQIWRIEVRMLPGHRAGSAAGDGLSSTLPCWRASPCCQPHPLLRHQPLLVLLPLPALLTLTVLVGLLFLSQLSVWLRREAGKLGVLGGQPLLSLGHADGACSFQLLRQLL